MRVVLPLVALALATGAAAREAALPEPIPGAIVAQIGPKAVCRDRIHLVREERGLPKLEREPASAEEPLLIAAVDKRIDGCSVLVMRDDIRDVRPLPTFEGPGRLERIR
ncbi:MAG TPA: hypothetical protein VEB68_05845 [Croceibacterium sp.]|nr:hypothetical protein [Croceibacterium sp.]